MEGQVKCSGCGWSWNKSDSSKKDMYVCHQCGKDNTMKNGGWLNKYDDGGVQPNYNDASVSMSDDFVGLGYDTKGRNYSPAWGGQFQEGGKLNPLSPMQQVQQAVQPTPTVPYLQTKDPAEFYKSWIQSPEYERRQLLTGYSEGEDLYMPNAAASRESRLGAIEQMTPITYNARQPSEAKPGVYGSPSYVNINPSDYVGTSKEAIQAHELAHVAGAMGEVRPGMMSSKEQEIFKKSMLPMKEPVLSGVQGSKEREASVRALEDFKHSQEPDEAKADLDALRFMMYDKGIYDITKGKKFTETDFQKAKQNLGNDRVFKRLENRMGKGNFVKLMNTIASADNQEELPMAMGGMSIPGSVGFSYARVAGAAPSKGKYAKKTMASAQIGKNVKKDATNIDTGVANKIAGLELQQNPEYQYFKYLQSLPQLRQAPGRGEELMRKGLGYADVATDVMQMGNFIPHPTAQAVGKVGNIAGMIVDGLQGADEAYRGNYLNAGINLASVALPMFLGSNTFRRNAMNLRPGDPLYSLTQKAGKPYTIDLNKTDTGYLELFSKVKGMKDKSLMYNRAFLGGLGAETAYDAGLIGPVKKEYGGEIPSAQNGIMSPMLLARNVLNYFYPSEEATPTVSAQPVNYKKGLTNELLQRQAYKESTFNPAAVSPAGYKGLTQIGEGVLEDYSNKKGGKKLDPFNPEDAVELQKFAMDDLYNASFINKPNQPDSVRIAKTLAAYNWGRGNLANYLNEQKSKGVDIYDSYDWLNNLPKETSDYVNKILLQEDPSFNKNYKKASTNPKYEEVTSLYDQKKFGGDIPSAQNGQEMRFYQNGLDWKPKSMQNGGDEIYEGLELPEFVVEGKDERMKEAMSQGIRKFYAHVGELMGAPQKEMMQLVTGKEQTPSEAWGFQNPGGWLDSYSSFGKNLLNTGLDLGLDPVNAIPGIGLVDDLTKGAIRLGAKQAADTSVNYLTTKTPLRNTYKINPFAVKEPDVILTRAQKPGQTDELRRLDDLEAKGGINNPNIEERFEYRQMLKSPVSTPGYGRWFGSEVGKLGYYTSNYIKDRRGYDEFSEILKLRLPGKEAKNFNVGKNPVEGAFPSYAPNKEFILPQDLVFSAESFIPTVAAPRGPGTLDNFIRTVDAEQRIANTPNWLRGYPSVANKSSDVSKSFKSEIDWSKWNPDTPKYPQLIKEYNKIEEATKKAGTWMQNPDGSVFKGTPEQFIQQQSSYFKKAYPQGYNEVYRGVSANTSFPNFNESADPGLRGPRGIFTANKELASNYIFGPQGWKEEKRILTPFDPDNTPGLFELIYPKGKQITRYQNLDDWTNIDLARTPTKENIKYNIDNTKSQLERRKKITEELASTEGMSSIADQAKIEIKSQEDRIKQLQKYYDNFDNIINDEAEFNKMKKALGEQTTTDTIAKYIPNTKLRSVTLQDIIDSGQGDVTIVNNRPGNYLKSMVGNVGFFDLKNPNVYKGIVPAGIATSLTFDQQKNGGVTKDDRGYWNPENWGKPVEIGSNNITMEGVNQPLLGISDTGDTKLMKPGKNYKFKGKKVTEYPVAKLGINQLDAQPMKKLNQLLNFTNNPDKDNWLDKYN